MKKLLVDWILLGLACIALSLGFQWGFDHLLKRRAG